MPISMPFSCIVVPALRARISAGGNDGAVQMLTLAQLKTALPCLAHEELAELAVATTLQQRVSEST